MTVVPDNAALCRCGSRCFGRLVVGRGQARPLARADCEVCFGKGWYMEPPTPERVREFRRDPRRWRIDLNREMARCDLAVEGYGQAAESTPSLAGIVLP